MAFSGQKIVQGVPTCDIALVLARAASPGIAQMVLRIATRRGPPSPAWDIGTVSSEPYDRSSTEAMKSLHLLYHEIRPGESAYRYVTSCAEFASHCELYARISADAIAGTRLQPRITFDDGHGSDLAFAAPLLERFGLRGQFFITAGWTARRAGFMGWQELKELQAAGHEIGAHGMTHRLLTTCSAIELREELQGARQRLEDGLGRSIETMSLPGGRANRRVLAACREAGYRQVFTSMPGTADMRTEPAQVGRLNLLQGTSPAWLEQVLDPATGRLARLRRVALVKAAAQRALGDRLYARLWAVVNRHGAQAEEAAAEVPST